MFFITTNGGDAESRGIELSAQAYFNNRWQATLGYSYNSAELTSISPCAVDGEDGLPGGRLAATPEHQFNALLQEVSMIAFATSEGRGHKFAPRSVATTDAEGEAAQLPFHLVGRVIFLSVKSQQKRDTFSSFLKAIRRGERYVKSRTSEDPGCSSSKNSSYLSPGFLSEDAIKGCVQDMGVVK